jgi:hypothetical protein
MKRQNIFLLLILTFIFTFGMISSCRKDKNKITINGTVYDPNIKTYVSGANVTISSSRVTNGVYNSNYADIATTTTDGNGAFTFEFDKEKSAGYRIYVSKADYFDYTVDISDDNIIPGTPYTPNYTIYPVGYIKLHVKNTQPYDSLDFIAYSYASGYLSCYECCTNTTFKGYGDAFESTTKCKTYGSQDIIVSYHITKNSIDVAYTDTFFATPFDTTVFNLYY